VLFYACAFAQERERERERGCKKKYAEIVSQVPLTVCTLSFDNTKRERKRALFRRVLLRGQRGFSIFFFRRRFAPKVATSLSTSQIIPTEQRAYPPPPKLQTNAFLSLSFSLSQIEPKAKKEEGTGWRRLLCSHSPPLPRSSAGVQNPSREAEEEEEEEARRRRGRRLLHRMRRRGTRTTTRRRKRHPPRTNARINRVKVKCGGQTLLRRRRR
jgi:hypothetical protein